MIKLRSLAAGFVLAVLSLGSALGQGIGQLGSGQMWANPTANQSRGQPTGASAYFDFAYGNTRGAILERGASGWQKVNPSATSGLPWVSNGTGADPAYQAISGSAFSTQSANTVFAGPTNGVPASPTFRALVGADLPTPGASSLGGVQSLTCSTHNWFNSLSTGGVFACTQPSFADLTSSLACSQTPALTGDVTTSAGSCATTIAANAVTNAKMATMAANTLKANATGSAATPTDVAPAAARSASLLNIDQFTGHGDSAYTILTTDRTVGTNAAFTASRTWTLPAANGVNAGQEIIVADFQGTVTGTNTLVISRAGSDTVNGGTSVTITAANGAYLFKSDGVSKWTAQALGAAAAGGVSSITAGTGLSGGTITTSGTIAVNLSLATNSLASDVTLSTNAATYSDGPSVAQGTSGTWFASGTVLITDTGAGVSAFCKLWDGTTIIASAGVNTSAAGFRGVIPLSGYLASPAGNIRISCANQSGDSTTGMRANNTGLGKDSTLSAVRVQ